MYTISVTKAGRETIVQRLIDERICASYDPLLPFIEVIVKNPSVNRMWIHNKVRLMFEP